ncbi:hypothetical protein SLE2022_012780 [Rubroshorea leprosula]
MLLYLFNLVTSFLVVKDLPLGGSGGDIPFVPFASISGGGGGPPFVSVLGPTSGGDGALNPGGRGEGGAPDLLGGGGGEGNVGNDWGSVDTCFAIVTTATFG